MMTFLSLPWRTTSPVTAAPFTLGPTHVASGLSPFPLGCGGPGEASPDSVLYQSAEVETHVAVNPTDPNNIVMFWQQDRWSDGGAHGDVAAYTLDGGATWQHRTEGMGPASVHTIQADLDGRVYVGTSGRGLFRSVR